MYALRSAGRGLACWLLGTTAGCIAGSYEVIPKTTHEQTLYTVRGKVEKNDLTRTPVTGAVVTAFRNAELVASERTNSAGEFTLEVPCFDPKTRTYAEPGSLGGDTVPRCKEYELRLVIAAAGTAEVAQRLSVPRPPASQVLVQLP